MKKLCLKNLKFEASEMLGRNHLKTVLGGMDLEETGFVLVKTELISLHLDVVRQNVHQRVQVMEDRLVLADAQEAVVRFVDKQSCLLHDCFILF